MFLNLDKFGSIPPSSAITSWLLTSIAIGADIWNGSVVLIIKISSIVIMLKLLMECQMDLDKFLKSFRIRQNFRLIPKIIDYSSITTNHLIIVGCNSNLSQYLG